jgi:hypothetical protein
MVGEISGSTPSSENTSTPFADINSLQDGF